MTGNDGSPQPIDDGKRHIASDRRTRYITDMTDNNVIVIQIE